MISPQIQQTLDYSIFKILGFNRDKRKRQVETIKKAIQAENLLSFHPIIVNERMEVIDGQHRLEAAMQLGLPIFYVQGQVSYDHILISNLIQKRMSLEDAVKFYALKDNIESYLLFRQYLQDLKIGPKALMGLFFGTVSVPMIQFMKSGRFKMPENKDFVQRIVRDFSKFLEFIVDKKIRPVSMFTSPSFTVGYRNLVLIPQFNESIFFSKLSQKWFDLKPQLNASEWTRLLISIYNWKNHYPLEV